LTEALIALEDLTTKINKNLKNLFNRCKQIGLTNKHHEYVNRPHVTAIENNFKLRSAEEIVEKAITRVKNVKARFIGSF
jgi:hypothetical protein